MKTHLSLLEIEHPEGRSAVEKNNVQDAPARAQTLARLMFVLENLGVPVRPWSLDKEKLLAVNDGVDGFVTHLTSDYW